MKQLKGRFSVGSDDMNNIIVITGPSGVGKPTLQKYLKEELGIKPLICATTRNRREDDNLNEIKCITEEEFLNLSSKNKFFFYSGDYYKYGYFYPEIQSSLNSFVTSYRDLPEILSKSTENLNVFSLVLAFSDIEKNCRATIRKYYTR